MKFVSGRQAKLATAIVLVIAIGLVVNALTSPSTPLYGPYDAYFAPRAEVGGLMAPSQPNVKAMMERVDKTVTQNMPFALSPTPVAPVKPDTAFSDARMEVFTARISLEVKEVATAIDQIASIAQQMVDILPAPRHRSSETRNPPQSQYEFLETSSIK